MKHVARILLAVAVATFAAAANAAWPDKPVRLLVGFAPGGSDIGGRIIAQKLSEMWGQPVVVDNRPGAAGNIAADAVAKAPPDGYTMLLFVNSYTINTSVYKGLQWDAVKDFAPVGRYTLSPMIVVVNPKFPAKNVKEMTDYAKANPGKLFFGSAGSGTAPHLVGELYAIKTGAEMTHVPYKGSAPSVTGLVGGEVQLSFAASSSVAAFVKDGRLRPLAVTTAKRDPQFPDLPTMEEAGIAGFDADIWYAFVMPAKTPPAIIRKVSDDLKTALSDPDIQAKLRANGLEPAFLGPDETAALIKRDVTRWKEVADRIKLQLD
ncbi:MAG: tripartite tricarboxylate transporter substrate binding protein [Casimicrobiaceae bacterium]